MMTPTDSESVNKRVVETNVDKFENQNAVTGRLVGRFMDRAANRVALLSRPGDRILDVGAGEGTMTAHLSGRVPDRRVEALEYEPEGCAALRGRFPRIPITQGSAYELPWPNDCFDVVTSFEVLEHLDHPGRALAEMARVAKRHVVVTVPHEPYFRMGNIARGRYVKDLGNTPGHLNHWSRASLERDLRTHFTVVEVVSVFPWLLATAAASDGNGGAPT